jgi:D-aspartate ligase
MVVMQDPGQVHFADVSTPVVVLKGNHHGSLGIARSLGRLGVSVYCIESDTRFPALRSRFFKRNFVSNFDPTKPKETISDLLNISKKIGKRSILIATSDESAVFFSEYADELSEGYIYPHIPHSLAYSLTSKKDMGCLAKENGVPTPNASFPKSRSDVVEFLADSQFPIVLKAIYGSTSQPVFSRKNQVVQTKADLLELFDQYKNPSLSNVMLQEYIPGSDESVWMFNGYFDERSNCLFGITGKKIRQAPAYGGTTSLGICVQNDKVANMTKDFMKKIAYKGILDIGYRYDERDGKYKVLDINPRIGCTFRLFVGDNGLDVARVEYLNLTGGSIPLSRTVEGRKWFAEDLDFYSSSRYFLDRNITLGEWIKSFRGVKEAAWFAFDDPLPFLMMGLRSSASAVSKMRAI